MEAHLRSSFGSGGWQETLLYDAPFFLSSFGEDESGELYVAEVHPGAVIHKIIGDFELEVTGVCPGQVSVELHNGPPNAEVAVVGAANNNGFIKGGLLCNGTSMIVGEPFQLPPAQIRVDALGNGSGSLVLEADRCWMQGLAFSTCEVTNALQISAGPAVNPD